MALVFIMGFFFDWIEICLIVLPIFAPILKRSSTSPFTSASSQLTSWSGSRR
jgi:TRAP-type mannitol/chloroaromatic compound transport system permease large subunit